MSALGEIIKGDKLAEVIATIVRDYKPATILEIGSSDGSGSSTVFAEAIKGTDSKLYCIEAVSDRFSELKKRMAHYDNVTCYNVSSVDVSGLVSKEDVFNHRGMYPKLNIWKQFNMGLVMQWYQETIDIINKMAVKDGIYYIKNENNIRRFDMVLIDGSPFTAMAELEQVYGTDVIVMDDTMDIKCYDAMVQLLNDPLYKMIHRNDTYRNGFAAFKLKTVIPLDDFYN